MWFSLSVIVFLCSKQIFSEITFSDKGYSGIVVAFSPSISEEEGFPLIQQIEDLFINASSVLYEATNEKAFFKEIIILVPQHWTNKNYLEATSETFRESHVRIDEPNPFYADGPYTLQNMGCGNPGLYIHLTTSYLKNLNGKSTEIFGDPAKTFVHEWAHFRYGVFDEFGSFDDDKFPNFYLDDDDEEAKPNYCADEEIKGRFINKKDNLESGCSYDEDGVPDKGCVFDPYEKLNERVSTSLNSYHFFPNVKYFCNESNHNDLAPNKQNFYCKQKSSWDVIMENEDFQKSTKTAEKNFTTIFKIVQQTVSTFILVLDYSKSMNEGWPYTRIDLLRDTVRRWIKEEVKIGWSIGIVSFATSAKLIHPVTTIRNDNDKIKLLSNISTDAKGNTCIGCGLKIAVQELKRVRNGPGGTIILVSDGKENTQPSFKSLMKDVLASRARVISIAISHETSTSLELLSKLTNGKMFFVSDKTILEAMGSAFYEISIQQEFDEDLTIKLSEKIFRKPKNKYLKDVFIVDYTVGNDTVLSIAYQLLNDISHVNVSTADGTLLAEWSNDTREMNISVSHDGDLKLIRFQFLRLQPGTYEYVITRSEKQDQVIVATVSSKSSSTKIKPIVIQCWMSQEKVGSVTRIVIFGQVKQGNYPVINAKFLTKIERPDGTYIETLLMDNGKIPDIQANDGIYSKYFTQFAGTGRYSIKGLVFGTDKTKIREMGFIASRSRPIDIEYLMKREGTKDTTTGSFERATNGGSVNVENIPPSGDLFPPIEINDFLAINQTCDYELNQNLTNCQVTLQWTASGDDLDYGNASQYDVRYSENFRLLTRNFSSQLKLHIYEKPLPAGETERKIVNISNVPFSKTIYVALKTSDEVPKWSDMSNVIRIRISQPPQSTKITAIPITTKKSLIPNVKSLLKLAQNDEEYSKAGIIGGLILAGLMVVTFIGMACHFMFVKVACFANGIYRVLEQEQLVNESEFSETFFFRNSERMPDLSENSSSLI